MLNNIIPCQPPDGDLFDSIRRGYDFVAEHARHVRILEDRLKDYAKTIPARQPDNTLDETHHYLTDNPEHLAAYVFMLEAMNFGSGFSEDLEAEGWEIIDGSVYFTVSTRLKEQFRKTPLSAADMASLSSEEIISFLKLPRTSILARFVSEKFCSSINELGLFIDQEYKGRFFGFINSSHGLAADMVGRLGMLPGFNDVHSYHNHTIQIFKRAQHAAASLHGMFEKTGVHLFRDIDRLTIFADNAIPHVLRVDGILEYDQDLAAKIDSGETIASGSVQEIEIRCCAAAALERIAAMNGVRSMDIDYTLWHRSVEDPRYQNGRAHKTLTCFY